MFTLRINVIKMSIRSHYLHFLFTAPNIILQFGEKKYLLASRRFQSAFLRHGVRCNFSATISSLISTFEIAGFCKFSLLSHYL